MKLLSMSGATMRVIENLNVDAAADRVVMREAMEELHRMAQLVSAEEFEALMPLAICMFAHCLGVTRTHWISPSTVRALLSGTRHGMFAWLDDVFEEAHEAFAA